MGPLTEEAFRALLDDRGLLREAALAAPDRDDTYCVFAQRPDAMFDVAGLRHNAEQFFATKIGLTVDKHYELPLPLVDAARIVVASKDTTLSGTRLCYARAADASDLAQAEQAERASRGHGLALLAKRCPMVFLITAESAHDRVSLGIAAIFASVFLGPILCPGGEQIVGVRSARLELDR